MTCHVCHAYAASDVSHVFHALGALRQKPRPQLLGSFLTVTKHLLPSFTAGQLCDVLTALAALQLTTADTQVGDGVHQGFS